MLTVPWYIWCLILKFGANSFCLIKYKNNFENCARTETAVSFLKVRHGQLMRSYYLHRCRNRERITSDREKSTKPKESSRGQRISLEYSLNKARKLMI